MPVIEDFEANWKEFQKSKTQTKPDQKGKAALTDDAFLEVDSSEIHYSIILAELKKVNDVYQSQEKTNHPMLIGQSPTAIIGTAVKTIKQRIQAVKGATLPIMQSFMSMVLKPLENALSLNDKVLNFSKVKEAIRPQTTYKTLVVSPGSRSANRIKDFKFKEREKPSSPPTELAKKVIEAIQTANGETSPNSQEGTLSPVPITKNIRKRKAEDRQDNKHPEAGSTRRKQEEVAPSLLQSDERETTHTPEMTTFSTQTQTPSDPETDLMDTDNSVPTAPPFPIPTAPAIPSLDQGVPPPPPLPTASPKDDTKPTRNASAPKPQPPAEKPGVDLAQIRNFKFKPKPVVEPEKTEVEKEKAKPSKPIGEFDPSQVADGKKNLRTTGMGAAVGQSMSKVTQQQPQETPAQKAQREMAERRAAKEAAANGPKR